MMIHRYFLLLSLCCSCSATTGAKGRLIHQVKQTNSTDGSEEVTITFTSPNVTITQNSTFICMSVKVPNPYDESYIVGYKFTEVPMRSFFMISAACVEAGYRPTDEQSEAVWDCSQSFGFDRKTPGLPLAGVCRASDPGPIGTHTYVYNGGPGGNLRLPSGAGYAVGGKTGLSSLIAYFHIPRLETTIDGRIPRSSIQVIVRSKTGRMKHASNLLLMSSGMVAARSEGSVTAVYRIKQEDPVMQLFAVSPHSHSASHQISVSVIRPDGQEEIILQQNPRKTLAVTSISDWPERVVSPGYEIAVKCLYNNRLTMPILVQTFEMCSAVFFFTTVSGRRFAQDFVYSYDPVFAACLPRDPAPNYEYNIMGYSSYHASDKEDVCELLTVKNLINMEKSALRNDDSSN